MSPWPQPVAPLHPLTLSAIVAALPLALLLVLMGLARKSGLVSAAWGLIGAGILAIGVWGMPVKLAVASIAFGAVYGLWPIMWIVVAALWLYNLSIATGQFVLLQRWMMEHASGDRRIQVILVAFAFGALLEGTAGFGAPVAVAAYLLLGLGFTAAEAVTVCLIANTAPVAFGGLGIPIVALAAVTGLNLNQLSSMAGRQVPFLSLLLPGYLVWVVAKGRGLRETWPAALVAGASFALTQFLVSNLWGPYAADILAALASILALVLFLRIWKPRPNGSPVPRGKSSVERPSHSEHAPAAPSGLSTRQVLEAWAPWILLSIVMVAWSYLKLLSKGQFLVAVPYLNNGVFITLYQKSYAAVYVFQPLAAGTAAFTTVLLTALIFAVRPRLFLASGPRTLRQVRQPILTVVTIVGLAYLYNYSGMAYTLGAALAALGWLFPLASGFLGWMACFLSGSDTASNLLFGNLQVAAAHQLGLNPVLLAATNSSGAVTGKMVSPQNVAVGVTTVGLVGQEGNVVRSTFWHSLLFAGGLSVLAFAQAYWLKWMVP
ncbi:MAG: lactate permease [Acidobacteria bacterium]|nr:MAG: lactate permease [Acidobacteriota bacterium]